MSSFHSFARAAEQRSLAVASRTIIGALSLALLAAVGCGGKSEAERVAVFPVQGKITFKGQPTVGAIVSLHPKNEAEAKAPTPRANVSPDGTFNVTTYTRDDGAPEGEYVLTVSWYKPVKQGADLLPGPNVIPSKYQTPTTSDLEIKVAAGPNNLEPIKL